MYFPARHSSTDSCPLEVPNMPKPQSCHFICLKGTKLSLWDEDPMQSLADEHCNPPWYHITQHCIFPSTVLGGLGIFLSGEFPLGRFLGSVFSSPSLPLSCCGKACSRIVSCRVYDARLGQMDRFACYQVVGVFDGCRGDSSLQPVLALHPCAFQFAPALWLMKFQCSLI